MTAYSATESQIHALMEAAEQARQTGNEQEADRLVAQARNVAPDHPGVLNVAGLRALGGGDAAGARRLFEQAVSREPASPMLWLHLALAIRDLGDQQSERDALEKALQIDPRYFPALLHKARLFERQGKTKLAAQMYYAFVCCLPAGVAQPPGVGEAVQHANAVIQQNDAALESFLRPRLEEARARHAGARLDRFDACLDTLVGRRRLFMPQPTFLQFPRLPAIEFLDRETFPWLSAFEAATADIREEA